jgi:hypothetical protein
LRRSNVRILAEFLKVIKATQPPCIIALGLDAPIIDLMFQPLDLGFEEINLRIQFTDPLHHTDF